MGTRHFFRKVDVRPQCPTCQARPTACKRCKATHCQCKVCPSRANRPKPEMLVIAQVGDRTMALSAAKVRHLQAASKGGTTTAGRPNPGRFTSETGRKAAYKVWNTRWRRSPFQSGVRFGRPRKNRPAVNRMAIRAQYAHNPANGLQYHPATGPGTPGEAFWSLTIGETVRYLSERAALIRLGHLPHPTRSIPIVIKPVVNYHVGMKAAKAAGQKGQE